MSRFDDERDDDRRHASVMLRQAARNWDFARRGESERQETLGELHAAALEYARACGWRWTPPMPTQNPYAPSPYGEMHPRPITPSVAEAPSSKEPE